MEKFERIMGFVLLGASLYYISLLMPSFSPGVILGVLIFLLVLSFLLWIWGHWFGPTRTLKENFLSTAILLVLITFSGWFTLDFDQGPANGLISGNISSQEDFDPTLINALLEEHEAVLVDVWATWCTQCKINEEGVFSKPEVQDFLRDSGVALLKADATRPSPGIEAYLSSIKKVGLPVYVYYSPDSLPGSFPRVSLSMSLNPSLAHTLKKTSRG
jgi:thiol:disulfide interchange protein